MHTTPTYRRRTDTCPECGGDIRGSEANERVCRRCGLVLAGPDQRRHRHTGASTTPTRPNRGLSTWMGSCGRDGRGARIPERRRRRLRRQRRRQRRAAMDATREALGPGLKETARLCSALDLPESTAETASVLFRRAVEADLLQGWAYESIAAAGVSLAARQTGTVRSLDDVVAVAHRPRRRVARAVRYLQRELGLAVEPPSVVEFLPGICDSLAVPDRCRRRAETLVTAAVEANVHSGRNPSALAASAVYTVTLLDPESPDICQTLAAEAADASPPTVRRHHRELRPLCPDIFDVALEDIADPSSRAGQRSDGTAAGAD